WIEAGAKNTAEYTGLKPGHYRFEVKGRDGQETYPVTSFTFIISPPWWATTWFRILIAVSIGTLVYMLIRRRIQSIRKEATLQQRVTETEMMALRSQMNPHFIFNCINSIDAMIQQDDKYRATLYLNKFAKLIRNVLDTSRQNSVALTKDLETLQLYVELEKFRHPDQFTVDFNVEPELWQSDYKVPPLIIQPYVENAILHGLRGRQDKKGELHIRIRKSNHHLVYEIEDNGVGRSSNAMKNKATEQGLGMQMSSDRIRLFNQEERASVLVEDLHENGQATGTKVTVTLNMQ
ncbi:MAG TPA: histidine kinase, partial [Saprospiraceae bacterium]|nr:histidine kinase [Saprospiraceae bacterium]